MPVVMLLALMVFIGLIFAPQLWIRWVMASHGKERADFPGTGGELARYLLDKAGLAEVTVEKVASGDHYSPSDKAVRLSVSNYDGKSVTAVAVAAHEVGHALQDQCGYKPLVLRQKLIGKAMLIERVGGLLLMATPLVFALTRSPVVLIGEILVALAILSSTIVIHVFTLPTEFNASFHHALPNLAQHLPEDDMPAARRVLQAAAFTYVAGALISLMNVARWLRILRF